MMAANADEMARQRTVMAADRTLMAWIRTALSLISFGFTVTKFFQYLQESGQTLPNPQGPRNLGLTLATLGVFGVLAAVVHYQKTLHELGIDAMRHRFSATVVIALVVAAIGGIVFYSGLTRTGPF
jgi:putative membrane protein